MSPRPEMRQPRTTQWNLPISTADFDVLKKGFQPEAMEDKWTIDTTHLHESNAYSVAWSRSWTGYPHYVLIVKKSVSGSTGPAIESMIYESFTAAEIKITAGMAKEEVICLARNVLGCDIEEFPEIDYDRMFVYPLEEMAE